jgi:GTP cyclohydrolase II
VYNLRKRGGDSADKYFKSTELIAGVKDMRFQALMPDVLHWLGIKKIDNMVSMSDMKYNAIVQSGIPITKRYDIPGMLRSFLTIFPSADAWVVPRTSYTPRFSGRN